MNDLIKNRQLAIQCLKNMGGSAEGYEVRYLSGIPVDSGTGYEGKTCHQTMLSLEADKLVHRTKKHSKQVTWHYTKFKKKV